MCVSSKWNREVIYKIIIGIKLQFVQCECVVCIIIGKCELN